MKNMHRKTKELAIRPGIENDGKAKSFSFFQPISFYLILFNGLDLGEH
jgi:hypothetical protein